jgi:hypothetical protein
VWIGKIKFGDSFPLYELLDKTYSTDKLLIVAFVDFPCDLS